MVPVYSVVSFLSYLFYLHSIYFDVLRDCYEAFAIASFFTLICHYIAPDLHNQKDYFRTVKPKDWIWPLSWLRSCCGGPRGCVRTPRSGLTWFNVGPSVVVDEFVLTDADNMAGCVPILSHSGLDDLSCSCQSSCRQVLLAFTKPSLCSYLGMYTQHFFHDRR